MTAGKGCLLLVVIPVILAIAAVPVVLYLL